MAGLTSIASDSQLDLGLHGGRVQHRVTPGASSASLVAPEHELRLISYLGSKLRVLEPILAAIDEVTPRGRVACDLFAGSGVVSLAASRHWAVTAIDIQEYSRVLCAALLNPLDEREALGELLMERARSGSLRLSLRETLKPLIDHERRSLRTAVSGSMGELADLLECGPLRTYEVRATPRGTLDLLMQAANAHLGQSDLGSGPDSVVTRYFGGVYYSWEQAIDLDALLREIHALDDGTARDYFLAALLAVASQAVNTVGKQFAQPIRPRDSRGSPKRHLLRQTLRDRSVSVFEAFGGWLSRMAALPRRSRRHRSIRADFRDALSDQELTMDVVYADPPYTRDHYSRFYHALETMALHDEPDVSTTSIRSVGTPRASRGIYRAARHQSPFSIKSQAPGAFNALFEAVRSRGVPLVLSYSPFSASGGNRPRLLTTEEITDLAGVHFRHVEVRDVMGLKHNKLNIVERNVDVDYIAEVLFVCLP